MSLRTLATRSATYCNPAFNFLQASARPTIRRTLFTHSHSQPHASSSSPPRKPRHTAFRQASQRRTFTALTDSQVIQRPGDQAYRWKRIAATTAAVGAGAFGLSLFNNRETRGALSPFEANYLNKTFTYVGAGLGITATSAFLLHRSGLSYRVMRANPWLVMGVSLVGTIGSMVMTLNTAPENAGAKHFWWTAFNVAQSATLSPMFFFHPALLARAGLYTAGLVGSLAYVGATARSDKYLYIGGPLFAGLCVVALSSLAPMILPVGTAALAVTEGISLYGGLAVFGGFVLFDTQKVLEHGRAAEKGLVKADPVAKSVSLELDFINLFIRIVQILGLQQSRRK